MMIGGHLITPQESYAADNDVQSSSLIKIGILAHRGKANASKVWKPLILYLQENLPAYQFKIIPVDFSEMHAFVNHRRIDLLISNPGFYIELLKRHDVEPLATLEKEYQGMRFSQYGAVIFTLKDNSNIDTLEDLKQRKFMGVYPDAFGGFQMAWRELREHDIDPYTELADLRFSGFPHSAVVAAVATGIVDAGTVRTGILESMHNSGLIDINDFKILNPRSVEGFPYLLSTDLYPEWPIAYLSHLNPQLAEDIQTALQFMPEDLIAPAAGEHIVTWLPPADYSRVDSVLQNLEVGPYRRLNSRTALLFLKQYLFWVIAIAVLIVMMSLLMLRSYLLNRKVILARDNLEMKMQESQLLRRSLRRERNFLRALLDNITDGVVACDTRGVITTFNQAAADMSEIDAVDIKGRNCHEVFKFYQRSKHALIDEKENPFWQVLNNKPVHNSELNILYNGEPQNLLVSGQTIVNDKGEKKGAVFSFHDVTAHMQSEQRLRDSERELRAIMNSLQDTYYRADTSGNVVLVSPSVEQLLGYSADEAIGMNLPSMYVEPEGREKFLKILQQHDGKIQNYQMPMWHKDGHIIWVSTSAHFHYDKNGEIDGVEGVTRDITELKNAEALLFQEKERAHITLQSIGDGVITMNVDGFIQYLNPYAEKMVGCSIEQACDKCLNQFLYFAEAESDELIADPVTTCLDQEDVVVLSKHIHAIRNDHTRFAVKLTVSPMRNQQAEIIGVVMVMHDVSAMWKMAQQLSYQASHDALTGLINRREFDLQLGTALERSKNSGCEHSLCYMDLDQFKIVNDTCGHIAGDNLLKQLAQVLRADIRNEDVLARLGGDEFGLLLEGCNFDKAEPIAEKIRKTIKDFRFTWEDKSFELGVSIGMVPVNQDSISISELLSEADAACYVAKDLGRNRIHKYQHGDSELVKHKSEMQWVNRIKQALEENRFICYCQQIQPLTPGDCPSAEILLRMLDEDGDLVQPGTFIPAAERFHLMPDIDRWVIRHVMMKLADISVDSNTTYTINLSGQSVGDDKILQLIIDCIHQYKVDPAIICFEITETAAVANFDSARIFIDQLHELGCQFALDDFGSGLSSFAYLKNLNVDYLKIDGCFIHDINHDPVDYAMVASINRIGHLMGIKTIAEFVEDDETLKKLKDIGIDYVQGYKIDKPKPFTQSDEDQLVNS